MSGLPNTATIERGYPKETRALAGTLFWEYAKKVVDILGVGKDAVFNTLLTSLLMRSLVRWNVPELLQGNQ